MGDNVKVDEAEILARPGVLVAKIHETEQELQAALDRRDRAIEEDALITAHADVGTVEDRLILLKNQKAQAERDAAAFVLAKAKAEYAVMQEQIDELRKTRAKLDSKVFKALEGVWDALDEHVELDVELSRVSVACGRLAGNHGLEPVDGERPMVLGRFQRSLNPADILAMISFEYLNHRALFMDLQKTGTETKWAKPPLSLFLKRGKPSKAEVVKHG